MCSPTLEDCDFDPAAYGTMGLVDELEFPPDGSHHRIRNQVGLPGGVPPNFTLYSKDDAAAPGTFNANYNGKLVANDTEGTRRRPPRAHFVIVVSGVEQTEVVGGNTQPKLDLALDGTITLRCYTDSALPVEFYDGAYVIGTTTPSGGKAELTFSLATLNATRASKGLAAVERMFLYAEVEHADSHNHYSRVIQVRPTT